MLESEICRHFSWSIFDKCVFSCGRVMERNMQREQAHLDVGCSLWEHLSNPLSSAISFNKSLPRDLLMPNKTQHGEKAAVLRTHSYNEWLSTRHITTYLLCVMKQCLTTALGKGVSVNSQKALAALMAALLTYIQPLAFWDYWPPSQISSYFVCIRVLCTIVHVYRCHINIALMCVFHKKKTYQHCELYRLE